MGLCPVICRQTFGNARRQQHFHFTKLLDNTCLHCRSIDPVNLKYLASFRAIAIAPCDSPKRHRAKCHRTGSAATKQETNAARGGSKRLKLQDATRPEVIAEVGPNALGACAKAHTKSGNLA